MSRGANLKRQPETPGASPLLPIIIEGISFNISDMQSGSLDKAAVHRLKLSGRGRTRLFRDRQDIHTTRWNSNPPLLSLDLRGASSVSA